MSHSSVARGAGRHGFTSAGVPDRALRVLAVLALVASLFGVFPSTRVAHAFSEDDANATLTVVKQVDNQQHTDGDGLELTVCDFTLRVDRLSGAPLGEVATFQGAGPEVCHDDPQATTGTTTIGVHIDVERLSPSDRFVVTEPNLDAEYVATFGGDCDLSGQVSLERDEHKTCVVTNTYVGDLTEDGANALLTVVKQLDNQEDDTGIRGLQLCQFELLVQRLEGGSDAEVATFPAAGPQVCGADPPATTGTTTIGIKIDPSRTNPEERFFVREPQLDDQYLVTFSGDCDLNGVVTLERGAHKTCDVTNTFLNQASMAGADALLTVIKRVEYGQSPVGTRPNACDFQIELRSFTDNDVLASFMAERGESCGLPDLTVGTTQLGVNVPSEKATSGETFLLREVVHDGDYVATFSGGCDAIGRITIMRGEQKECVITNTFVGDANQAPVASDDVYATDEDSALIVAVATGVLANDEDADGDTLSASLDTGTTDGSLVLASDGSFTYTPGPKFNGVDSFTYVASDGSLQSNEATVTITVGSVDDPPVVSAGGDATGDEGGAIALDGSVADSDSPGVTQDWTYASVSGVDVGATCTFTAATATATSFSCTDDGDYQVTLSADDGVNGPVSDTATVTVGNVSPSLALTPPDSAPLPASAPVSLAASYTDPGSNDTHTCAINWGDGSVESFPGDGGCDASHSYAAGGSFSVTVTVTDDDDGVDTETVTVVVNSPPVVSAGADVSGDEGDAITLGGTVLDVDGPSVSQTWTYAPVSGVDAGATCSFAATTELATTITCTDDGTYAVTLTASDTVNAPVSDSATVTIQNVAPVVGPISAPADPVLIDTAIVASASFSDPGVLDTHAATIDWGDGATTDGTVSEEDGSGNVSGSHAYTTPGVYTITLTVADDDGGSAIVSYQYVVVYDPDGGFVTGGGWIWSPAGAYVADPALEGKASFGFVAKYKKGQSAPDGNTQFQFKAGGLNFHSSSYEWLVIAGAQAKFKGIGTLNGTGGYGFMLTAVDGQVSGGGGTDTFRIKIWDTETGTVVYDNQSGDSDDAAATTALGGGSIVIHKAK